MKPFIYILIALSIAVSFCTKNDNPVDPSSEDEGVGKFLIQTQYQHYTWATVESGQSLYLTAYLVNLSDSIYYSHLGDRFAGIDQEYLYIGLLGQGGGYFETYNTEKEIWEIINDFHILTEGSRFISVRPYVRYILQGSISSRKKVTGKCRLRIEYYDQIDPASDEHPYVDYSNIFSIGN